MKAAPMSEVVEIPVEVWEHCQRDAATIAFLHKECVHLKAKVERLRKAGDAMVEIVKGTYCIDKPSVLIAWNAAKEGRPNE